MVGEMSSRALKSAARGRYSHHTSALFIIVMLWAGLSWASAPVGQSLDATLAVARNALLPAPAYAGGEVQQQQAERQREAQQQQAERQRETQQQQVERQRETQEQAERQSENHANEIEGGRTENNAGSQSDDSGNSRERYRESDARTALLATQTRMDCLRRLQKLGSASPRETAGRPALTLPPIRWPRASIRSRMMRSSPPISDEFPMIE